MVMVISESKSRGEGDVDDRLSACRDPRDKGADSIPVPSDVT